MIQTNKLPFLLLIAFALCFGGNAYAEPGKADSIRHILVQHQKEDSAKAALYLALADQYSLANADSVFQFAKQALLISERVNFKKGIANAIEDFGTSNYILSKYDSALYYFNQSLEYCRQNNLHNITSSKYNHIANVYFTKSKYALASTYYDSSLSAAVAAGLEEFTGMAYSNKANVFYIMGNYPRALKYYLKGLKIQEKLGNSINIASDVSNIANVYYRLGQYKKAIEYLDRGMEINKKNDAKEHIIACLTTYAMIYSDRKLYDSSLLYLNDAMVIADEMKNIYMQNLIKGNIAECYLNKGELDKSFTLYEESFVVSKQLDDAEGIAIAKAGIGNILIRKGDNTSGIVHLKDALSVFEKLGIIEQAMIVSEKLASVYEQSGDYKNALAYNKITDAHADSLAKARSHQQVEQMLFNYEIQKKEDKIILLEKDKALGIIARDKQKLLLWAFIIGFLLAATAAYLFFRNALNVKKSNAQILKQKEEIEHQARKLAELNEFKDTTFSVLSHDLRSPVNALTSTMMLLDEKIITPEEFALHKNELNNKLQSVSLLLDNMLEWAKSQMKGEHTLDIEKLNIKRKALKTMAVLKDAAAQKNILLSNTVPENIWAYGDRNQVDIVIRNIVSNAIKFTPQNGKITISAAESGNTTQISITDTGVGMTATQIEQLFVGDTHISTKGTSGEKGTGLGLHLSHDMIKKNGGSITVQSNPGEGSTFIITLPNSR